MAPPPTDHLRKIGVEGFALIDKYYGNGPPRNRSSGNGNGNDAFWNVVQVPNGEMEEPAIMNSKDAAVRYGGVMVVNYPKPTGKPLNRWGRPIHKPHFGLN